ncbi:MAG: hypothetical protein HQL33_06045 [Alphaproteobacteria bacterium]|nr:hypothetical protein [Alphaproteobacteria bacterium]MBF0129533.1 hypothetical protein [Alphaproteobacteria bacterium]
MSNLARIVVLLVVLALIGGGLFLAMWDMPAPRTKVEKAIPHATLDR